MLKRKHLPVALTIAGSDSGGGAGIQADLKTFAFLGVHGASVLTCVTAQNPRAVLGIQSCSPVMVRRQLEALFEGFNPASAKAGMMYSAEIIRVVARFLGRRRLPLVVNPVMVSTSGARLLKTASMRILLNELLPLASLVTPNIFEAEILAGSQIRTVECLRAAACEIHRRFGCAALVKGGHLRGVKLAVDVFCDGKRELLLSAPFVQGLKTHGTGCTYSAAMTAWLARGASLRQAVRRAKDYVTRAIKNSIPAGRFEVLGWGPDDS